MRIRGRRQRGRQEAAPEQARRDPDSGAAEGLPRQAAAPRPRDRRRAEDEVRDRRRQGGDRSDAAATLDKPSEDAVGAFNAKVDERNRQIEAYEAKVAAYNKDADNVRALSDEYARSCANRRYDDRDLADIQRKK